MQNNNLQIIKIFSYIFLVLLIINLFIYFVFETSGNLVINKIIDLFNFNCEANLPTLFICTILAFIIYQIYKILKQVKNNFIWKLLFVFFLYVLFDEFAQIHEIVALFLKINYPLSGIWNYEWVIVAIPVAIILITYLYISLSSYQKEFKYWLLGGFLLLIAGEVIFEMAGGLYMYSKSINSFFAICEESLEVIGLICIYYVLCNYNFNKNILNRKNNL